MIYLIIIIALVLIFNFINGFHDSANAIATIVTTKVLSPVKAVVMSAFFNFIAFLVFKLHVATTIGKGIVNPDIIDLNIIAAGIIAAIIWNLFTWWKGLPSSSSHTLVGGLVGAGIAKAGLSSIVFAGIFKIVIFIVLAPLIGMIVSFIISNISIWVVRKMNPHSVDKHFRRLQLISSAAFSLGHGGNDAQKSMGLIWVAMIIAGLSSSTSPIPFWIVIACNTTISLGTLFGGWKIVKTMGQKIAKLKPFEGFCAETAGALTLFGVTELGIPVSTTHTITGSIMGAGVIRRGINAVKWGITSKIFWAWILTIPISAVIGTIFYLLINLIN